MTQARIGYGAAFQTSLGGIVWVTTGETTSITLPPISRDAIDCSHECAPNEWRTSIPGLKNGGEVTVDLNFTNLQYILLRDELSTNVPYFRRIVFPDGTAIQFSAFLTGLDSALTVGDKQSASARFKVIAEPGPPFTP